MGGQANVIAALWGTAAQPGALTARHEEDTDMAGCDGVEADNTPFGRPVRISDCSIGRCTREWVDGMRILG